MVDPKGLEPSTLRMRTVRSPKLSYGPIYKIFRRQNCQRNYFITFNENVNYYLVKSLTHLYFLK